MPFDPSPTTTPDGSETFADLCSSGSVVHHDLGTVDASELIEPALDWARRWTEAGLEPGHRIGLWLANGRRYLEALAACAVGGFVAVSVNTRWSQAEADTVLRRSGARRLVTNDDDRGLSGGGHDPLELAAGTPFVVFTTSGTTSRPKMVVQTRESIVAHARDVAAAAGYRPDRPVLAAMPLCGVFGLVGVTGALAAGAPIHLPAVIDPAALAATVERERIWAMNGSDDLFHRMVRTEADLSSVQLGGYARFNTSLGGIVERAEERGMRLTGLYGMSEVQALFSIRDPSGPAPERARAGGTVVSPRAEVRVVDDEIQIRGPSLFAGYLTDGGSAVDDELTAAAFTFDGWFRTGDAGAMDPDGVHTFEYRSRMGDVLRLGGFLVAPAEIEQVLLTIDGIEQAQVVTVDRPAGARPVAFIIVDDNVDDNVDEDGVIEYCRRRLARYKVPIRVLTIERFPTTPSANGTKIQKVKLRELAARALAVPGEVDG